MAKGGSLIRENSPKCKENLKCEITHENDCSEGSELLQLQSHSPQSNDAVVLEEFGGVDLELTNLKAELKVLGKEEEAQNSRQNAMLNFNFLRQKVKSTTNQTSAAKKPFTLVNFNQNVPKLVQIQYREKTHEFAKKLEKVEENYQKSKLKNYVFPRNELSSPKALSKRRTSSFPSQTPLSKKRRENMLTANKNNLSQSIFDMSLLQTASDNERLNSQLQTYHSARDFKIGDVPGEDARLGPDLDDDVCENLEVKFIYPDLNEELYQSDFATRNHSNEIESKFYDRAGP